MLQAQNVAAVPALFSHALGRGRVKTLPQSNFTGRLNLGEGEKIAPDAI